MELKDHQDCPWMFLCIRLTHKKTTVCKQLLTNNLGRMLVWVTNCCMYKPRVVEIYETTSPYVFYISHLAPVRWKKSFSHQIRLKFSDFSIIARIQQIQHYLTKCDCIYLFCQIAMYNSSISNLTHFLLCPKDWHFLQF